MGAEVSGVQLYEQTAAEEADRPQGGRTVQSVDPGTDVSDTRCEHCTDGGRSDPIFTGMDRLFREMRNTFDAAKP